MEGKSETYCGLQMLAKCTYVELQMVPSKTRCGAGAYLTAYVIDSYYCFNKVYILSEKVLDKLFELRVSLILTNTLTRNIFQFSVSQQE